ncbi:MAG: Ppx/GppA family phosphatase [Thermoanaerobacteraceae bacterium]|nr:Ppx/GppA family phosphatase [Thermoanaerobacteraceae bacterium]
MRVAVIDIGTNSTRLLVAEVQGERVVKTLHTGLVTTRLGENIGGGRLLPRAMDRTLRTLQDYLEQIRSFKAERILAAATSAVRDAANREEFLVRAGEMGLAVRVLSGEEEARLSYRGVRQGLDDDLQNMVVMDIGGGSTEFIWSRDGSIMARSVRVGAVRMTEGGHDDGEIRRLLEPVLLAVARARPQKLVGVGGTVTTMAAMAQKLRVYDPHRVHGYILTAPQVEEILALLRHTTLEERRRLPGLQPERADVITAGVRIARLVLQELGLSFLQVSENDIMYGLALEAARSVERKNVSSFQ